MLKKKPVNDNFGRSVAFSILGSSVARFHWEEIITRNLSNYGKKNHPLATEQEILW